MNPGNAPQNGSIIFRDAAILFLANLLPGMSLFLPLGILYVYNRHSAKDGHKVVILGMLATLPVMMVLKTYIFLAGSVTLIAAGYMLVYSSNRGDTPFVSFGKAFAVALLFLSANYAINSLLIEGSLYSSLTSGFQASIDEMIAYYSASGADSAETREIVLSTLHQAQQMLPDVLPSLLLIPLAGSIWLTLAAGNRLIERTCGRRLWPDLPSWRVPEPFVWVGIISGFLVLIGSSEIYVAGLNSVILCGLIYALQGFSICSYFMLKWNVSIFFKLFFYVVLLCQSFALVLLAALGVVDVWADFRKLNLPPGQKTQLDGI